MKRVSFEVAKDLKEAGYPQTTSYLRYNSKGGLGCPPDDIGYCVPTYLEVWLWLWREKRYAIDAECKEKLVITIPHNMWENGIISERYDDPEDAIIAAIEYLVEHKLLQ